jgi:hypothetical protein
MIPGQVKAVIILGVLVGATLLGGIIGAGVDYVTGNAGWWGVIGLIGLISGVIATAVIVEGTGAPARR